MGVAASIRVAAVLLWINGAGFGVFCLPGIRNLLIGRLLWPAQSSSWSNGKA
jgi:hypothetical protein